MFINHFPCWWHPSLYFIIIDIHLEFHSLWDMPIMFSLHYVSCRLCIWGQTCGFTFWNSLYLISFYNVLHRHMWMSMTWLVEPNTKMNQCVMLRGCSLDYYDKAFDWICMYRLTSSFHTHLVLAVDCNISLDFPILIDIEWTPSSSLVIESPSRC